MCKVYYIRYMGETEMEVKREKNKEVEVVLLVCKIQKNKSK